MDGRIEDRPFRSTMVVAGSLHSDLATDNRPSDSGFCPLTSDFSVHRILAIGALHRAC